MNLAEDLRAAFSAGLTADVDWRRCQLRGLLRMLTDREEELGAAVGSDLGKSHFEVLFSEVFYTRKKTRTIPRCIYTVPALLVLLTKSLFSPNHDVILLSLSVPRSDLSAVRSHYLVKRMSYRVVVEFPLLLTLLLLLLTGAGQCALFSAVRSFTSGTPATTSSRTSLSGRHPSR
jgi:hypothetical protein